MISHFTAGPIPAESLSHFMPLCKLPFILFYGLASYGLLTTVLYSFFFGKPFYPHSLFYVSVFKTGIYTFIKRFKKK